MPEVHYSRLIDQVTTLLTENADLRTRMAAMQQSREAIIVENADIITQATEVGHLLDEALEKLRVTVISRM